MASASQTVTRPAAMRGVGRSLLLTLPIALWTALMFSRVFLMPGRAMHIAAVVAAVFTIFLFFKMMQTRETYRWRRWFFATVGWIFPVGFIASLIELRGSMDIPIERMIGGDTPFCFMVTPMLMIPAALGKTLIFPGSILPTASNPHSIAVMIGLWLALSIVLGKGWCAYGCFFGGIEEGFAAFAKRPRIRKFDPRLRMIPWAVLLFVVLLSAAIYEPVYCMWLCPFKAVTEFPAVRSVETALQFVVFVALFAGLVVVLPFLTKKRTQCAFFCPFGAFQSIFNKANIFEIRVNREKCKDCNVCSTVCPTQAISRESAKEGGTLMNCIKCGACVDACKSKAAVWHIKGTGVDVKPERARLMFLYGAWAVATMFGGSILANGIATILHFMHVS